jgi:dCMP deaminase
VTYPKVPGEVVAEALGAEPVGPATKSAIRHPPPKQRQRPDWDTYFLDIAEAVSKRSHDADTHVGCVIVSPEHRIVSTGYNGFAPGMPDGKLPNTRPDKYPFMVHAEANAIATAQHDLRGCTCYCLFTPCNDCAKLLLAAGIKRVVCRMAYWNSDWEKIQEYLKLGGIEIKVMKEVERAVDSEDDA